MKKPIYNGFLEFVKATFNKSPEELPTEQHNQLKMAFYGGAVVTENLITEKVLNEPEAAAARMIFTIQEELIEFGKQISK